jgi:hypothetical protein
MRKLRKKQERTRKIHTSIYLLPRHRAYLDNVCATHGISMTAYIAQLIEGSMPKLYDE